MNERLKVKKVGKHAQYGEWLLVDDGSEKGSFRGTTAQVSGFLSKQVPCEVEVESVEEIEGRKGVITRVKVLGEQSVTPQPSEQQSATAPSTPKQEFKQANEYYDNRQESIVNQFCIREGIKLVEVFNSMSEEKIKPTKGNVFTNAKIIKEVYDKLMNPDDMPDY